MEQKLIEALAELVAAIEKSELGWNGIDAFPEDFYPFLEGVDNA